jgi:hypothetical protein
LGIALAPDFLKEPILPRFLLRLVGKSVGREYALIWSGVELVLHFSPSALRSASFTWIVLHPIGTSLQDGMMRPITRWRRTSSTVRVSLPHNLSHYHRKEPVSKQERNREHEQINTVYVHKHPGVRPHNAVSTSRGLRSWPRTTVLASGGGRWAPVTALHQS